MLDQMARFSGAEQVNEAVAGPAPSKDLEEIRKDDDAPTVTRPFSELPKTISRTLLGSWLLLVAIILFAFGGRADMSVTLGVVVAFAAAFFGTPLLLLRIGRRNAQTPPKEGLQTLTGPMSQREVLIQITLLPILLSFAMALIGYFATHAG